MCVSNRFVKIKQLTKSIFLKIRGEYLNRFEFDFKWLTLLFVSYTHRQIKTVRVIDLLLIKQQLKRYKKANVAYIKNVLKEEAKYSEFNSQRTTEITIIIEEKSLFSKERLLKFITCYKISRETEAVVKKDSSLKAKGIITAGYSLYV
jgi:hypothetical protein